MLRHIERLGSDEESLFLIIYSPSEPLGETSHREAIIQNGNEASELFFLLETDCSHDFRIDDERNVVVVANFQLGTLRRVILELVESGAIRRVAQPCEVVDFNDVWFGVQYPPPDYKDPINKAKARERAREDIGNALSAVAFFGFPEDRTLPSLLNWLSDECVSVLRDWEGYSELN